MDNFTELKQVRQVKTATTVLRIIIVLLCGILLGMLFVAWFSPPAKAQDIAIGDSIALGTGHALGVPTNARARASSCWVLHHVTNNSYRYVVVSAGINDAPGPCVRTLFARIKATRVVVILPAAINSARANVAHAAQDYGYLTISYACRGGCSKRNFHPGSYAVLAGGVRKLWTQ